MSRIQRFEDIEAWKIARELTREFYILTNNESFSRDYGLKNQISRAAVSIMSNIAEGFERDGNKEFISFLSIAKGSAGEVRSQLYVAFDQNYITENDFRLAYNKANEAARVISGLMKYLRQSEMRGKKFN